MKKFKKWLITRGAEILQPTSQWEAIRFNTAAFGLGIVYVKKNGSFTLVGAADGAHRAFVNNASWNPLEVRSRVTGKIRNIKVRSVIERDGANCFYCGFDLGEDITIEHLLSINCGGSNHVANLVLAHNNCNQNASHLSIMEKIKLRKCK